MLKRAATGRRVRSIVALALAALAVLPAIASAAGVVSTSGTQIIYTGSASADSVTVDDAGTNSYTFAENGITAIRRPARSTPRRTPMS